MIFLSLVLVIVAAVALVLGVFQDGLVLIYVSIATCVAAMAVLGVGVLLRRRDEATAAPAGYRDAGAGRGAGVARTPASTGATRATEAEVVDPTVQASARTVAKKTAVRRVAVTDVPAERSSEADVPEETTAPTAEGETAVPPAEVETAAPTGEVVTAPTAETAPAAEAAEADAATPPDARTLRGIRGLGPAKQEALLERFGSVDAVAAASIAELTQIPGIAPGLARAIKDQLA